MFLYPEFIPIYVGLVIIIILQLMILRNTKTRKTNNFNSYDYGNSVNNQEQKRIEPLVMNNNQNISSKKKICPYCSAELDINQSFCTECGKKL